MIWKNTIETCTFRPFSQFSCSVTSDFLQSQGLACHASLSITNSRNLLKLMPIESVMQSNHLIVCCPLLLPPSIFPSIRVFSNESVLCIRWPNYWSLSLNTPPLNMYIMCVMNNMTSASSVHEAGHPKPCSGRTQRDRVGREVGEGFRMGGHMYTCGQFMLMHDKNHPNIVK